MNYYVWTIGCQMNRAESLRMSELLDSCGLRQVKNAREADIAILNTCVVRQNAEDKVVGTLGYIKGLKLLNPGMLIAVTGCFVGPEQGQLLLDFPHVDFFFQPGAHAEFEEWLAAKQLKRQDETGHGANGEMQPVVRSIPIMQGCNNFCSYCIVPYRRGRERSRPAAEIMQDVREAVDKGAREVILLGQNVNAYGHGADGDVDLAGLLAMLNLVPGLLRIRFLTNHPKDMGDRLIEAIAELPGVCHHLCLPLQAGDDDILNAMNRGYTVADYRALVDRLRRRLPDIALSTDLIVGFPGETEERFRNTLDVVSEMRFDVVHAAAYSVRSGTKAASDYRDDVPVDEKVRRLRLVEAYQAEIAAGINKQFIGSPVEVLVEGKKGVKWYGRSTGDKLVFFTDAGDWRGRIALVEVLSASPWALQGKLNTVAQDEIYA
jgi:tRNA-2-methylthio-N6-dimethylallyladenosine synthase